MFWAYRQALIHYASDPLVHKIVVDLSRMVRVCLMELAPKKKAVEGGAKTSRMAYGKRIPSSPSARVLEINKWRLACEVAVIAWGRTRLS